MKQKKRKQTSRHHRLPTAQDGTSKYPKHNVVLVSKEKHDAWHTLFAGDMTAQQIAEEITRYWIDPRLRMIVVQKQDGDSAWTR